MSWQQAAAAAEPAAPAPVAVEAASLQPAPAPVVEPHALNVMYDTAQLEWRRGPTFMGLESIFDHNAPQRPTTNPRKYSKREDYAIVTLVSLDNRAHRVNGKNVWRELLAHYPRLTGRSRSWQSLRSRYLRNILPKTLAAMPLPPELVTRLRAGAADGVVKARRRAALTGGDPWPRVHFQLAPESPPQARSSTPMPVPPAGPDTTAVFAAAKEFSLRFGQVSRQLPLGPHLCHRCAAPQPGR